MHPRELLFAVAAAVLASGTASPAIAQSSDDGPACRIVVADQTGAVIVGARVTLTPVVPAGPSIEAITDGRGEAVFTGLQPGRYTASASFDGFEPRAIDGIHLRRGTTRREVRLPIAKVAEDLVVGRDPRERALDPRGDTFSNVLSREQIEALPDDPDDMEEALKQMAGPGARVRVDGFSGGKMPPKGQIRSIRFRRDMYAAENHGGGMVFVDIVTSPGGGPLRGNVDFMFRDDGLNARNAFAPVTGDERQQNVTFTLSGTLIENRTGFSLTTTGTEAYDSRTLVAALPDGAFNGVIRRPAERRSILGRIDHALTKSHTLRASYQRNRSGHDNLGVGDFDLSSRGYSRDTADDLFRLTTSGPLGRRAFGEVRFQTRRQESESVPITDAPAVVVLDAFSSGGAQIAGGRRATDFEFGADVDYARGRHSARAGILLEGGLYRSDDRRNYAGTFTFASLADYQAGRPTTFSQRLGEPFVEFSHAQFGWYVQDDIRIARPLSLSLGLRQEFQTHVDDALNLAPRASLTWSPSRNGSTTIRAGGGIFYEWFGAEIYEQTLRVDGERQTDLVVRNPGFPDPLAGGDVIVLPSGRLLQADDLTLPTTVRGGVAVERALTGWARVMGGYSFSRGRDLFRGRNINAPRPGEGRPDPGAGNVTQVESTGRSEGHMLNAGFNVNLPWHRLFAFVNYTWSGTRNDTDGPFSLPADNFDLEAEWGPAATDIPHRVSGMFNMNLWKGFRITSNFYAMSGAPYTITTGRDENTDTVSNDRPAGVGRNTARTPARWDVSARLSWAFGFGTRSTDGVAGGPMVVMHRVGGEASMGGFSGGAEDKRWRFELFVAATNLFNHTNLLGYSGVMTSPFFGKPTSAGAPRRVEIGARFGF